MGPSGDPRAWAGFRRCGDGCRRDGGCLTRRTFYRLAESPRLHSAVRRSRVVEEHAYRRASRYLGGRTRDEAIATLSRLHREGFATGVDFFGEQRTDPDEAEAATNEYLQLNRQLAQLGFAVNVWVDPSNIGLDIGVELCRRELRRIVDSLPDGSRLQVRAHDSGRVERILDLALELAAEGAPVMPTLQANLRAAPRYAERLIDSGVPVLLVKGAFLESRDVAYPWGEETDAAFLRLAHQIGGAGERLAIGTHDPVIRQAVISAFPDAAVEMLRGVREGDARKLVAGGRRVRIYVPYGKEWMRYWLRRLGEARGP